MELVLYKGVKGAGGVAVFVVVAAALLKDIGNLLIGAALAGADLPNALEQLVEVIFSEGTAVFQHFVVEHKALLDVLPQRLGRPLAEPGGLLGVHPVAHGDDGVQIVVLQLPADFPISLFANHREFLGSCLRGQFFLCIDVF